MKPLKPTTSESHSKGRRLSSGLFVSAAALSLAACATPFKADVERFAAPLPAPQGMTFAVVPEDPKLAGGLEFAIYAKDVAAELSEVGYTPAASPSSVMTPNSVATKR